MHTGKAPSEREGMDQGDASTCQGRWQTANKPSEARTEAWNTSSQPSEGTNLAHTLISYFSLQNCEIINFCSLRHSVSYTLWRQSGKLSSGHGTRKGQTPTSASLTMPKPLTMWITINCGKFWKRWEYQTTWPSSWEICMQVRKHQLELDMEQQTGSK